jgi:ABC-2 type transport system ATP-binding protein
MSLLHAEHLSRRYGAFTAIHDVSLHLEPGEVVGFLGANGAGKTTTMKVLTGFVEASGGTAVIAGHDLRREPLACRKAIGYLPQEPPLYGEMTVQAYLDHVARLKGLPTAGRNRAVVEAMERCDILPVARRHIHKLSGGNRQRVGLAQALLGDPPILILDEATAGLDPTQVARFRELLHSLSSRHAILLSTHIMAEVEACCHRVVIVHQGRDILQVPVSDLQRRAAQLARCAVRVANGDAAALATALAGSDGVEVLAVDGDTVRCQAPAAQRDALIALAQAHGGLRELVEERRSLEEVFTDIVGRRA